MFGHVEQPVHVARHLVRTRALQQETGGFTEFVPLPFVHMATPLFIKGRARTGPTFREALLMHAVGRIAYRGAIDNIQVSWVKLGPPGARQVLQSGANDLGGTLMDENISRAAGASHGQEVDEVEFRSIIEPLGRPLEQRTTLYGRTTTVGAPPPAVSHRPRHDRRGPRGHAHVRHSRRHLGADRKPVVSRRASRAVETDTEPNYDVVAVGNALVDVLSNESDDLLGILDLVKGTMAMVDRDQSDSIYAALSPAVESSGGSAANTVAGVASFGGRAAFIGRIGDDQFGQVFAPRPRRARASRSTAPGRGRPAAPPAAAS